MRSDPAASLLSSERAVGVTEGTNMGTADCWAGGIVDVGGATTLGGGACGPAIGGPAASEPAASLLSVVVMGEMSEGNGCGIK